MATLLESYVFPNDILYTSKSVVDFKELKIGDHLMYKCTNGWRIHYYVESIYDDDSIQVRSWFSQGNDNPLVEQELFAQPDKMESMEPGVRALNKDTIDINKLSVCIYSDETNNISDERVKEFSIQHGPYNLLSNNSEHYIIFIKTGKPDSHQFRLLENAIVQKLIIQGGKYGFIPTVLAAIRLGVMKLFASFLEIVSLRVVQRAIEKTTEAVANATLDVLVVSVNEKSIDQIAQDVAVDVTGAIAQEIYKSTNDEVVSVEVIHNSIKVLCKEILTSIADHLLEKNTGESGKSIADHIAKEGLDVVTKEVVTKAMEDVGKDLVKQGVIQVESDFFEHLEEKGTAESVMKEILQNSKMAAVEQLTDEVVIRSTSTTGYHVAKNAIKSNITAGVVVEGVFYTAGMVNAGQKYYKGEIAGNDFVEFTVEHTASSSGSLAGGIGGSIAGAAAGAAIGSVVPVIGTTIGAGVGGFVGGMSGGVSGSLAGLGMGKLINWMWK